MLGMEMMFKTLGIDPKEVQAMIAKFGQEAEAMRLSQERTEAMVRQLHEHVFAARAEPEIIENKE